MGRLHLSSTPMDDPDWLESKRSPYTLERGDPNSFSSEVSRGPRVEESDASDSDLAFSSSDDEQGGAATSEESDDESED